jgi:signal peptidase II
MTDDSQQKTNRPSFVLRHPSSVVRHLLFWPIFIGGVILDLWTKSEVFEWLSKNGQETYTVVKDFFWLTLAQNSGAAFGIAEGRRWLLVAVSIGALIAIAGFLFSKIERKIVYVALGLLAAGVCGNLYDRLFNEGRVRDFIDVVYWPGKHWPAFNVADTMLCIAVGLLILSSFTTRQPSQKHGLPQK